MQNHRSALETAGGAVLPRPDQISLVKLARQGRRGASSGCRKLGRDRELLQLRGAAGASASACDGRLMINRHGGGSSTLCRPLRRNWDDRRYVCYPLANSGARLSFYRSRSAAIKQMQHHPVQLQNKNQAEHSNARIQSGQEAMIPSIVSPARPILKHRSHPSVDINPRWLN
jgi:hypothetical protein